MPEGLTPPRFLTRLLDKLHGYRQEVHRRRQELAESTREQALPPIPPGDRHQSP
jgi:hypothetical protein